MARLLPFLTGTHGSDRRGVEQTWDLGLAPRVGHRSSFRTRTPALKIGSPPVVTEPDQGRVVSLCAAEADRLASPLLQREEPNTARCLAWAVATDENSRSSSFLFRRSCFSRLMSSCNCESAGKQCPHTAMMTICWGPLATRLKTNPAKLAWLG